MSTRADIVVVGAGAAGIAAAISAARAGATTILMDQRPGPGGTGGFSGLTTLCGLYDSKGEFLVTGLAREFAAKVAEAPPLRMGRVWVLPYRPERFREIAATMIASEPNLTVRWNESLGEVKVEDGRIAQLNETETKAVIDCSGTAEVARAAGAKCLATDERTQSPAIIFPLHGVTIDLRDAASVTRALLPLARAGIPPLHFQPSLEPGVVSVKFTGTAEQVPQVIEQLRRSVTGFENCLTPVSEFTPARRAGRMIIGPYVLTGEDVLGARKFPDAVAQCAWPIEEWGTDGMARLRYLPDGEHYEITAEALRSTDVQNLFMAGKTISADEAAIGSARVMGCCLATGAAAGLLAARWVSSSDC